MHTQHCDCITVLCICLNFVHGCLEVCVLNAGCSLKESCSVFLMMLQGWCICSCRCLFACLQVYIYVEVHISMLMLVAALQKVVQFSLVYGAVSL